MNSMIIAALLFFQQQQSPSAVHMPTSDAIDVARKLARDLGYPIDRYAQLYFFDVLTNKGMPAFTLRMILQGSFQAFAVLSSTQPSGRPSGCSEARCR